MNREIEIGDTIYITKISGEKLDVPHKVDVSRVYEGSEMFKITPPIPLPSDSDYLEEFIGMDENSSDVWYNEHPLRENEVKTPNVGDTIYITKLNDKYLDVPHEVTVVDVSYYKDFDTSLIEFRPRIGITRLLYQDNSPIDEWHFEPPTQNNVYDDDAISPSYSEAVRAGKTFADYTGAHITEESLDFKTKEESIIEGITPESLNFEESVEDNVNHPSHYNYGDIEVIDFIEQVTSQYEDGYDAYIVGNVIKYLARSPHKNGVEDLNKAAFYLNRLLKRKEDE